MSTLPARPRPTAPSAWLAKMTPAQFMKRYWQKKPLLIRKAFEGFTPPVSIQDALALSQTEDVPSRLIRFDPRHQTWSVKHGPFAAREIPKASAPHWTVLVSQVNTRLRCADEFLDAFRFISNARLDDLMISVAGPEGGVGPHVDSYDVFLLQAQGRRRWEIAQTNDLELKADQPLKILRRFVPKESWVLEPGDMLYLPPAVAHRGVALGPSCMTWSIGFRAPQGTALADGVFTRALESATDGPPWQDPWLGATAHPAAIPPRLLAGLAKEVGRLTPTRSAIEESVCAILSEPADSVVFPSPRKADSSDRFLKKACAGGLALHPASRLLYLGSRFFFNGEVLDPPKDRKSAAWLKTFADNRHGGAAHVQNAKGLPWLISTLHEAYRAGWIVYH